MGPVGRGTWVAGILRIGLTAAFLGGIVNLLGPREILGAVGALQPGWVAAALLLSLGQVALSAWRWRFTAGRLGLALPFPVALKEYYLATFLNQTLPGGVMGDVTRAWRHAAGPSALATTPPPSLGASALAVVLERASGQGVMALAAVTSVICLPVAAPTHFPWTVPSAAMTLAGASAAAVLLRRRWRGQSRGLLPPGGVGSSVHRALLARGVFPVQAATSAAVVLSYLATFLLAARAVGVETPWATLLPLAAPVLLAMLLPVTVAGWGVREGAAALLWGLVGLPPAQGVAVSMAYGLLVLLSSAPGAVILLLPGGRRVPVPDRRGGPPPEGSGGTSVEAPGPAAGWGPG